MMQEQQQKTYKLPDNNVCISFSGGRTSAFMLHHILEANNGLPDNALVCFQNTGREMPQTLAFVNSFAAAKCKNLLVRNADKNVQLFVNNRKLDTYRSLYA